MTPAPERQPLNAFGIQSGYRPSDGKRWTLRKKLLHPTFMKTLVKSNLVTISGLSDESGVDRRTIKRYANDSGLEPVERKRGAAYYDRTELLDAISEVLRQKQARHAPLRVACESGPRDVLTSLKLVMEKLSDPRIREYRGVPFRHRTLWPGA